MHINKILAKFREVYQRGELRIGPGESIDEMVVREEVSEGYGVYVISGFRNAEREILYIGKSGTVCQDGSMKRQGIRKRLTMKQDGMRRRTFFKKVIAEKNLNELHIEWFVTYPKIPPFLAESELLAAYLTESGKLPVLNKAA